ncbi:hypothetical protein pb186bvf_013959 [Paramecium bursaria]
MIGDSPCQIIEYRAPFKSRHGISLALIKGRDIFNNKIIETRWSFTHHAMVPKVQFFEYSLIGIQDNNYLILLNKNGQTREDINLNKEHLSEITKKIIDKFSQGINLIIQTIYVLEIEEFNDFREELD